MIRRSLVFLAFVVSSVVAFGAAHAQFASEGCSAEVVASCPACASCDAQRTLDSMDQRAPVPLLPMMAEHQKRNMRDHLIAVQEIVTALAAGDFAAVEQSAAGRTGVYDITVRNNHGKTIALFRGKSYRINGEVIAGLQQAD